MPAYRYHLDGLDKGKKFRSFNMEQQAEIVAHYYRAAVLNSPEYPGEAAVLAKVLIDFLQNPSDTRLVPATAEAK